MLSHLTGGKTEAALSVSGDGGSDPDARQQVPGTRRREGGTGRVWRWEGAQAAWGPGRQPPVPCPLPPACQPPAGIIQLYQTKGNTDEQIQDLKSSELHS